MTRDWNEITRECEINGQRVPYDACSSVRSTEEAKEIYGENFEYIGTSKVMWINGVLQQDVRKPYHFFRQKNIMNEKFTPTSGMVFETANGLTGLFVGTDKGLWMLFNDNTHIKFKQRYLEDKDSNVIYDPGITRISKGMNNHGHFGISCYQNLAFDAENVVWERAKVKPVIEVRLNDSYTAKVEDDNVVVGCQTFPFSKVRELIEAVDNKTRVGKPVKFKDMRIGEVGKFHGEGVEWEKTDHDRIQELGRSRTNMNYKHPNTDWLITRGVKD